MPELYVRRIKNVLTPDGRQVSPKGPSVYCKTSRFCHGPWRCGRHQWPRAVREQRISNASKIPWKLMNIIDILNISKHSKTIDFRAPAKTSTDESRRLLKLQVMRCRWQRQNSTWETQIFVEYYGILRREYCPSCSCVHEILVFIFHQGQGRSILAADLRFLGCQQFGLRGWSRLRGDAFFSHQLKEIGDVNLRFPKYESCFFLKCFLDGFERLV